MRWRLPKQVWFYGVFPDIFLMSVRVRSRLRKGELRLITTLIGCWRISSASVYSWTLLSHGNIVILTRNSPVTGRTPLLWDEQLISGILLVVKLRTRKYECQRRHTGRHLSASWIDSPSSISSVLVMESALCAAADCRRSDSPGETTLGWEYNEGTSLFLFFIT